MFEPRQGAIFFNIDSFQSSNVMAAGLKLFAEIINSL